MHLQKYLYKLVKPVHSPIFVARPMKINHVVAQKSYHNFCSVNSNTLQSLTEINGGSYRAYRMKMLLSEPKILKNIYVTRCDLHSRG